MLTYRQASIKGFRISFILFLLFFWILLLPSFMSSSYELFYGYVEKALTFEDKGKLILAALILVLIYIFSEMMIFLATIAIGQKTHFFYGKRTSLFVVLIIITMSYVLLSLTFDYTLSLATPLIIAIVYIFLLYKADIYEVRFRYQAIFLFQLMLAMQWLEVNPYLQRFGFGKSEGVTKIINAAHELQGAHILQLISILISVPFFLTVILTFVLIHINLLRNKELTLSKKREQELQEMKIGAMESRLNYEMNSLVHDLKTPLTTIRGLISLVELQFQKNNSNTKATEYMARIEGSIQQLNEMISEILYENAKREVTLQELINYTRANFVGQLSQQVNFINHNPDVYVRVNRIRLVRALINLIQNAVDATESRVDGKIDITICMTKAYAHGKKQEGLIITVTDNGEGINELQLMKIWDVRYSTKGSSGLGLPFVKKVVNDHKGWIKINSKENEGTTFTLFLPKGSV